MGRAFEFRKERKFKRWGNMAKLFTRYGREITMAVKEGGSDPNYNSKLRTIIQNAKSDNVPKDNIERAIKKATDKDTADYKTVTFEGYAPHGVAVFIECATDNNTRTVANIRSYFNKYDGNLATNGSVIFLFDKKALFIVKDNGVDLEELELELIDFGAEEMFKTEDEIHIYAEFTSFGDMQKALEERDFEIIKGETDMIPTDSKKLSEEEQEEVNKLIEKIEDDDDVVKVFHNMA